MPFSQVKFCGATLVKFDVAVGWNEQVSTVTIVLVEDAADGDSFAAPTPGEAVTLTAGTFVFSGLVQAWEKREGFDGFLYVVTVHDPRALLEGVAVVLGGVVAQIPLPNVLNVYGYYNSVIGYGGALTNEAGMLWTGTFEDLKIDPATGGIVSTPGGAIGLKPGVEYLTAHSGSYGGPLRLAGGSYSVDLSGLPSCPAFYRVGGSGTYSLLEIVSVVCKDAGHDFLVYLSSDRTTIKFKTVSRTTQPTTGQVEDYVTGLTDARARNFGIELRNDVTNYCLVGGAVRELQVIPNTDGVVLPYWGEDPTGQTIIGTGTTDETYQVSLNATPVADIVGDVVYPVDLMELRCAASSFESWCAWVMRHHPDKASTLSLVNSIDSTSDLQSLFPDKVFQHDLISCGVNDWKKYGSMNSTSGDYWAQRAERMYSFVRTYASDFFGKKFLVRLPYNVQWKMDPETYHVTSSEEICDAGYLPETSSPLGLPYWDVDFALNPEGLFEPFASFPIDSTMDVQRMSPDTSLVSSGNLYVKVAVESKLVVITGQPYPFVVVTLAEPVYKMMGDPLGGVADVATVLNMTSDQVASAAGYRYGSFPVRIAPAPYKPGGVAVAIHSNRRTYGPWGTFGSTGPAGRTVIEHDESLTPWDYGDFATLSAAANARVVNAVTFQQQADIGGAERAGFPTLSPGDSLVSGGPSVTGISCSVSTSGVTTSYSCRTYTPQFGAFQKLNADRLQRLGRAAMQSRRGMRASLRKARALEYTRAVAAYGSTLNTARAVQQHTPHMALLGTMTWSESLQAYRTTVATSTAEEMAANMRADDNDTYWATGGMSLEGLLRPFSTALTHDDAGDMPHFESPAAGVSASAWTIQNINPFLNSDVDLLVSGKKYEDVGTLHRLKPGADGHNVDYAKARGLGLRGPLVLSGWGLEYTGKPLPNSGDETKPVHQWADTFLTDPQKHPEKWRAAPVALSYDNWRKCWTVPTFLEATADSAFTSEGWCTIVINNTPQADKVYAYNKLGGTIGAGATVYLGYFQIDNKWRVISAACTS